MVHHIVLGAIFPDWGRRQDPLQESRSEQPGPQSLSQCSGLREPTTQSLVLTFDTSRDTYWCRGTTPMGKRSRLDLLQGTLDLLILRTLQSGDALHGWAISERIRQVSDDVLQANQGSLYPALHRLEHEGWIKAEWGVSELGRRARFYRLTASGRKQLEVEKQNWTKLSEAIARVLRMA